MTCLPSAAPAPPSAPPPGLARGDQAMNRKNHVVAVVGDASIVNGLAFEGLNGAGMVKRQLLLDPQ